MEKTIILIIALIIVGVFCLAIRSAEYQNRLGLLEVFFTDCPFGATLSFVAAIAIALVSTCYYVSARPNYTIRCQELAREREALVKIMQAHVDDPYQMLLIEDRVASYNEEVLIGKEESNFLIVELCYDKEKWGELEPIEPNYATKKLSDDSKIVCDEQFRNDPEGQQSFPCSVGDVVYSFSNPQGKILPYTIETISVNTDTTSRLECFWYDHGERKEGIQFKADDLGKIAFFTREAAEVALAK